MSRVERYLARDNTLVAKGLERLSSKVGPDYRDSTAKRVFDVAVAAPTAALFAPATAVALVASALEQRTNPIYVTHRRDRDGGTFPVMKIRTMRLGADKEIAKYLPDIQKYGDKADPRITRLGRLIRLLDLDESLQLVQVLRGQMSVVGLRALDPYAVDEIQRAHPNEFDQWSQAYREGRPSVVSQYSAYNHKGKDEAAKLEYDIDYAREASLKRDVLIVYMHGENGLKAAKHKALRLVGNISGFGNRSSRRNGISSSN